MVSLLPVLRGLRRARRGVAALEFALIAPVLITLLGAAVDLGRAVERVIQLETLARAGAQYLQINPATSTLADTAGSTVVAEFQTQLTALGAEMTVSDSVCMCVNANGTVQTTAVACTTSCTSGIAKFRTVKVSRSYSPVMPTSRYIPFNALGPTQARSVVVRL